MTAPVTTSELCPSLGDDPTHPIPYLGVIDVACYKDTGGADLSIVIASPLLDDERSQTRLLDKIEGYLGHIASDQFRADAGVPPSPETTTITVALHPDSAAGIFALLDRCYDWVASANAKLVVRRLAHGELAGA